MPPTRLTFYGGGLPHFVDHLAPLWTALPTDYRSLFYARGRGFLRAKELGIEAVERVPRREQNHQVVVVASYEDYKAVNPLPVVLINHGVGQRYIGEESTKDHPSYSGGRDRERVVLYLCPSHTDAQVNKDAYPGAESVGVGPFHIDPWLNHVRVRPDHELIVFSSHADVHVCPETRSAFPHYRSAIQEIAKSGRFNIAGHYHPRNKMHMEKFWNRLSVPVLHSFSEVLDKACLYVTDNSSTLYEFAATERPVLVLNAPWYRRDVHHGLRFWDAIPGLEVFESEQLFSGMASALEDPEPAYKKRLKAVAHAYTGLDDGKATRRAVEALMRFCDG